MWPAGIEPAAPRVSGGRSTRAELRPRDRRGWSRTSGLLFVRQALWPAELLAVDPGQGFEPRFPRSERGVLPVRRSGNAGGRHIPPARSVEEVIRARSASTTSSSTFRSPWTKKRSKYSPWRSTRTSICGTPSHGPSSTLTRTPISAKRRSRTLASIRFSSLGGCGEAVAPPSISPTSGRSTQLRSSGASCVSRGPEAMRCFLSHSPTLRPWIVRGRASYVEGLWSPALWLNRKRK